MWLREGRSRRAAEEHRTKKNRERHGRLEREREREADFVVVPHDGSLEFGGVDPCHKVLHVSVPRRFRLLGDREKREKKQKTYLVTRKAGSVIVSGPTRT
jgi:hypothetical protein